MEKDKEQWKILVDDIKYLLEKEYSFENMCIMTKKITTLDFIIKNDLFSNDLRKEYEEIHEKYGKYRWINNIKKSFFKIYKY